MKYSETTANTALWKTVSLRRQLFRAVALTKALLGVLPGHGDLVTNWPRQYQKRGSGRIGNVASPVCLILEAVPSVVISLTRGITSRTVLNGPLFFKWISKALVTLAQCYSTSTTLLTPQISETR